jgi:hypothetical protein
VANSELSEIAAAEMINKSYVERVLRLTLLAPAIVDRPPLARPLRQARPVCGPLLNCGQA